LRIVASFVLNFANFVLNFAGVFAKFARFRESNFVLNFAGFVAKFAKIGKLCAKFCRHLVQSAIPLTVQMATH
jgi:hypothetical protein